ncbi:hypothetical protein L9F63_023129 [Diploptera punctata]|uniref:Uncharacterized protein n=1 Tax=Diploptera punctata TaxID=6984 RepID=A0AAD8E8Y1_DIPPU|nr:hypothetical protein L9F63_023129 [Diploptera punctata]
MNAQAIVIFFLMIAFTNGIPARVDIEDGPNIGLHGLEDTKQDGDKVINQDDTESDKTYVKEKPAIQENEANKDDGNGVKKQHGIENPNQFYNVEYRPNLARESEKQLFLIDFLMKPVQIEFRREREAKDPSEDDLAHEEDEIMEGAETLIFRPVYSYRRDSASRRRY